MLRSLRLIAQSELRIFLSEGYSLELLYILKTAAHPYSITQLYDAIIGPKPRKQTFDVFVRRLITLGFLTARDSNDRRQKGMTLSDLTLSLLDEIERNV